MKNGGLPPTLLSPPRATTAPDGSSSSAAATTPPRLGRYALLRPLGEGGMGIVHVAFDEWLDRKVAIKLLRHRGGGPSAHARMLREAQALARLAHPNVVAIHDVGEADDQVYIAMEFVTGVTLRTWLEEQVRTQAEILDVFTQAGRGLAAAHAAGLVHRDFKPDNVMIGRDGRVRVMDFGLARAPSGAVLEDTASDSDGASMLGADITVSGSIVGTPLYMAPEQLLGHPADARSDLYGFCVALYEALYAERPFLDGDGANASRVAFTRELLPTPADARVPAWLRRVVLCGLQFDAALRWPSMTVLLAALGRDPVVARRRAARTAALAVLIAAITTTISLGVVHLQRTWARERAEQLASERLVALDAAIDRATDHGRDAEAEAMFQTFVGDPEHRGTAALTRAWRSRGDQHRRDAEPTAALADYARAYVEARDPGELAASLQAMAAVFTDTRDGPGLGRSVAALRTVGVDDEPTARLAALASLGMRDIPGAAAELTRVDPGAAALWSALSPARSTDVTVRTITDVGPGRPARFIALQPNSQRVLLLDDTFAVVATWDSERSSLHLVPGTAWIRSHRNGDERILDAFAPDTPLWHSDSEVGMYTTRAVDLDDDGALDLLFGRAAPTRGFRAIVGLGGAAPREQVVHTATEQAASDIDALVAADLDSDGTPEIVAAAGAWQAYDLRVFHADATGQLELIHRRRLGRVSELATVRRGAETLLVAVKDDFYPNPRVFPDAPHTGAPAGVYLLRWHAGALVDVASAPLPRDGGVTVHNGAGGSAYTGDLDGDDLEEIVVPLDHPRGSDAVIVRQLVDDTLELHTIAGLWPLGLAQLDDDPALELLATVGRSGPLWLLGTGDETLPTLRPPAHVPRATPPSLVDPLLALRWTRADELAAIGVHAGAATSLQDAANLTRDPAARHDLLARAAAMFVAAGDDAAALAIDRDLEPDPETLVREAGALARLGDYDEAHAVAERALLHAASSPDQRAEATTQLIRVRPLVGDGAVHTLDFSGPLAPTWQIARPGALRRDPSSGALALTVLSEQTAAARLPLQWSGGPLDLEAEFTVDRLEYGSCLRISVVDDHGRSWLGGGVCGIGGGGRLGAAINCQSPGMTTMFDDGAPVPAGSRVRLRLAFFLDESFECTLDEPRGVHRRHLPPAASPPPGRYWLSIGAMRSYERSNLAVAALHSLQLRGARFAEPAPPDPMQRAAALLVAGDPQAALAALADVPPGDRRRPLWQALAHDDRHDLAGLTAAVADVSGDMSDRTWSEELILVLRTRPVVAAALRQRLAGAGLPLLDAAYSALGHHHRNDPAVRGLVLAALHGVEALSPTTPGERVALRRLLATRATLWAQLGEPTRAAADRLAALAVDPADTPEDAGLRADILAALAAQTVAADPHAALVHARAAIAVAPAPELVRMQLGDDPVFAARIAADPAWRDLLRR